MVKPEDTDPVSWSSSSRCLTLTQVESRKKLTLDLREWARNSAPYAKLKAQEG